MSARSGITLSDELARSFADSLNDQSVRFIKAIVSNESVILDSIHPKTGDFTNDLLILQDILADAEPAYVLARFDEPHALEWLAISYVPDSAKVREKMLYASSRLSLTQSLGSGYFTDSLFVSSKSELTPDSYKAHLAHLAAPKPMSDREKVLAELKVSERQADGPAHAGTQARKSHIEASIGLVWEDALTDALVDLAKVTASHLILATIDPRTETLMLSDSRSVNASDVGSALPTTDPVYALFAWCHDGKRGSSCPPGAGIKSRMLYAASVAATLQVVKQQLDGEFSQIKRIETSEPLTLTQDSIGDTFGYPSLEGLSGHPNPKAGDKGFSRPKGPARRR